MKHFVLVAVATFCAAGQTSRPAGLYATFQTSEGAIVAKLFEKEAPAAVSTFVGLAQGTIAWYDPAVKKKVKRPLYQDITFHRVVPRMAIQAGDPTGLGTHNCGLRNRDEFLPGLRFDRAGRLAVANSGEPDSGGCQFFITADIVNAWTGKYTIFGEVVEGMDVVVKISRVPTRNEKPVTPVKLNSVTIERVKKQ